MSLLRILCVLAVLCAVYSKKHRLKVENDERRKIDLTTYGYLEGGFLQVNITGFSTGLPDVDGRYFGFTLDKLESSGMSYLGAKDSKCLLTENSDYESSENLAVLVFKMDFKNNVVLLERRGKAVQNLTVTTDTLEEFGIVGVAKSRRRRSLEFLSDSYLLPLHRSRRQAPETDAKNPDTGTAPTPASPPKPAITVAIPASSNTVKPASNQTPQPSPPKPNPSQATQPPPPSTKPVAETGHLGVNPVPDSSSSQNVQPEKTPVAVAETPKTQDKITSIDMGVDADGKFNFQFAVMMTTKEEEGMYELYFHDCYNHGGRESMAKVNFSITLIEKNGDNYLSAGHIPLPFIFFVMSAVFFGLACFWLYTLKKSTEGVFKLHYLMLAVVYIKAVSLFFHAVNYYFLATNGHHEQAIAIIYYITYLMRGILLFVTIVLIGAGWAHVKYILSDRDKKIFIIVIPLQVLANVAQIIIQETEEGESQYITWHEVFIIVDLLCCGAILFPVVWSIRHLQEASQTDGKAAINLVKLKLFRHFYILIVCYIYFTRIIVYLLRIAVPFQYEWLDDLFRELATGVFYFITAFKFRPASDNPYLQVPQDSDDEVEMDEVMTQTGLMEGITKVNTKTGDGNEATTSLNKRESSHDYD